MSAKLSKEKRNGVDEGNHLEPPRKRNRRHCLDEANSVEPPLDEYVKYKEWCEDARVKLQSIVTDLEEDPGKGFKDFVRHFDKKIWRTYTMSTSRSNCIACKQRMVKSLEVLRILALV